MHGGGPKVVAGRPLDPAYTQKNMELLERGMVNLTHHIGIARKFGIPVVVAVNRFPEDSDDELNLTCREAKSAGAYAAVVSDHWARGGAGAVDLARAVSEACEEEKDFHLLYPHDWSIEKKVETIAREVYNADGVSFSETARAKIKRYTESGFADLPICMAKTHLSISHDPSWKGVPSGYTLPVRRAGKRRGRVHLPIVRRDAYHARPPLAAGVHAHRS